MARARNIKPGFFQNEELVELPFETRLLFIGLWTLADRSGRLEDRPKRIKMAVFPADDVDVNVGLDALASAGFIVRYCVNNEPYIAIPAWEKHQNPHHKEAQSLIPAPDKPEASLGQDQDKPEASTGVAVLIPDSGFLIPDSPSLIPDPAPMGACSLRKRRPPVPFAEIVDLYHQCLPELPRVEKLTKTREGYLRQRWQEDLTDLSHWRHYFDFVRQSPFLMGRSKAANGKPPFRADLEWITRPNNYAKIAEEKYHG